MTHKCKTCGKEMNQWWVCDENMGDDDEWCPKCFDETPCGRGEHGEECPTMVMEIDE